MTQIVLKALLNPN